MPALCRLSFSGQDAKGFAGFDYRGGGVVSYGGPFVVTPPVHEPVSIADAKMHCRIEVARTDEEGYIGDLITVARDYVEKYQNRALITQTLRITLDQFPGPMTGDSDVRWIEGYGRGGSHYFANGLIQLPRNPVQHVNSIQYVDTGGNLQTLDPSLYVVSLNRLVARIGPVTSSFWPIVQIPLMSAELDAITVEYVAGYGDDPSDVPASTIHAIKFLIGHLYRTREPVETGLRAASVEVHRTFAMLADMEKIVEAV